MTTTETQDTVSQLENEGNLAADYLEALLDILDMDGDIDIYVENHRAAVSVVGDAVSTRRLRRLVGDDGEVLDALQDLTRLAVQAQTGERSLCMVDVAGHRAGRRTELQKLADAVIDTVESNGTPERMRAMNAFERKVVHDRAKERGLVSESAGEEPDRHVIISPAAE